MRMGRSRQQRRYRGLLFSARVRDPRYLQIARRLSTSTPRQRCSPRPAVRMTAAGIIEPLYAIGSAISRANCLGDLPKHQTIRSMAPLGVPTFMSLPARQVAAAGACRRELPSAGVSPSSHPTVSYIARHTAPTTWSQGPGEAPDEDAGQHHCDRHFSPCHGYAPSFTLRM
jgi:hypothetical protein